MKLKVTPSQDCHLVEIEDARLDAGMATAFKDRMREIIPQAGDVVRLDLRNVGFMDSSGLGAVIAVLKSMPPDRRLELIGLTPNVERVFRLTRMDLVFNILPGNSPDNHATQDSRQAGDGDGDGQNI